LKSVEDEKFRGLEKGLTKLKTLKHSYKPIENTCKFSNIA